MRDREQLLAAGHAGLHEVDEPRAGLRGQLHVGCGGERVLVGHRLLGRPGADDADPAGPARGDRAAGGREDHLDHRDVVALPRVAQHRRARGVAGDDQRLDALGVEVVEALEGVLADLGDRLGAVGLARGVAEVVHGLVRELVDDRPGHGRGRRTRSRRSRSGRRRAYRTGRHDQQGYASRTSAACAPCRADTSRRGLLAGPTSEFQLDGRTLEDAGSGPRSTPARAEALSLDTSGSATTAAGDQLPSRVRATPHRLRAPTLHPSDDRVRRSASMTASPEKRQRMTAYSRPTRQVP